MKKILFALVAIALVSVSCKKNPEDKKDQTKFSLTMSVVGTPTATAADIKCTPNLDTCYYIVVYAEAGAEITAQDVSDYANEMVATYEAYGYGIEDVAMKGEQTITLDGLTPSSSFTAFGIQVDEKGTSYTDLFTCDFTTGAMAQSSMTIDITTDSATIVTFTPSASDSYGYYVEERAAFDEYYDSYDPATMAQSLQDWASSYAAYGMTFPSYTSTQKADLAAMIAYEEDVPAGTMVVAYAAPMQSGFVNGTANGIEFALTDTVVAKPASVPARAPKATLRMPRR